MTHVAIMIPMSDHYAAEHNAVTLRPEGWRKAERVVWPEASPKGVPLLPSQTAAETHATIDDWICRGVAQGVIVTRSEIAVLVARRMVATGFPFALTIHFPGMLHDPATVDRFGNVSTWPAGLFSEAAGEAKRIARAQEAGEKTEVTPSCAKCPL